MNLAGARRVMETTIQDTANQYLRFGWSLINQYVVEATADTPATVTYVLASIRRLEDTRQVLLLTDHELVNRHLELGWKLIDKFDDVVAAAKVLKQTRVNSSEFYDQLYSHMRITKLQNRKFLDKVNAMKSIMERERLLLGELPDGPKSDLWMLVNSVTAWVQHKKGRNGSNSNRCQGCCRGRMWWQ